MSALGLVAWGVTLLSHMVADCAPVPSASGNENENHVNDFYFNEYCIHNPDSGRIVQFHVEYNGLKDRCEARDVHDEYSDEFDESSVPEDLKEYLDMGDVWLKVLKKLVKE